MNLKGNDEFIWVLYDEDDRDSSFYKTKEDAVNDLLNMFASSCSVVELLEAKNRLMKDENEYCNYYIYKSEIIRGINLKFDLCPTSFAGEDDYESTEEESEKSEDEKEEEEDNTEKTT